MRIPVVASGWGGGGGGGGRGERGEVARVGVEVSRREQCAQCILKFPVLNFRDFFRALSLLRCHFFPFAAAGGLVAAKFVGSGLGWLKVSRWLSLDGVGIYLFSSMQQRISQVNFKGISVF